ncbi:MAG: glycosyltransferase family 39 protein [Gammaproteobacteria bacterium]
MTIAKRASTWNAIRAIAIKLKSLISTDIYNKLYDIKTGRYMTIIIALVLGFFVFRWSKELYGTQAGYFSLFLYSLSPNIIAHSSLITTDLYSAAGITIALYYYWRFLNDIKLKTGIKSAFAFSIAQTTKYTAVFLYPILLIIAGIFIYRKTKKIIQEKDWCMLQAGFLKILMWVIIFIIVNLLVINIAYLFDRSFIPFSNYEFKSPLFKNIQENLSLLSNIPVPTPYPYLEGLDWVYFVNSTLRNNIYLLGEIKHAPDQFFGYYFIAYIFKEPIAAQFFALSSLLLFIFYFNQKKFIKNEIFILFPLLFFIFYFNFIFRTQIGIRFIIVGFPLLYIFCGFLFKKSAKKLKYFIYPLIIFQIISIISYYPYYIPYFNELVFDRKQAYKILADSNINFGQDEYRLKTYLEQNPDVILQPQQPVIGKVIVDINFLMSVFPNNNLAWLRENFQPVAHMSYSHLIYNITTDQYHKLLEESPYYFPDPFKLINEKDDYYLLNIWQGQSLERMENYQDALIHYHKTVNYRPFETEPLHALIRIYSLLNDHHKSQLYRDALERLTMLEDLYQKGLAAYTAQDFLQASNYFSQLSQQQSDYKMTLFYQGLMLQIQNKHAEAIPYYRQFLQIYPAYYQAFFNLAFALMKTGECEKAIRLFERTLALKPDYSEANTHIRECKNIDYK